MKTNKKMSRADIIIMLAIMLIYSAVSFIGLGDNASPRTQPDMRDGDTVEYITYLTFSEYVDVENVLVYKGLGVCGFTLYSSDDGGESWNEILKQGIDGIYKWESISVGKKLRDVCISVGGNDALELFEVGFVSAEGEILKPVTNGCRLFDEQHLVPEYPSYKNGTYFDEVYHVRTAYEHKEGIEPFEISHPPLGKLIIGAGIGLFGMDPFGWRIMGVLFGIMMLAVIYVFSKRLFKNTFFATGATLFLAFDFMHFTQTRIATIDSFSVFFIILMYYLMYLYYDSDTKELPYKSSLVILLLCGIVFGIGISVKWICVYAGIGLAVLYTLSVINRKKEGESPFKTCMWCILFFIVIPFAIYFASYIPYYLAYPDTSPFKTFFDNQFYMLTYHGGLESVHDFQSKWYTWPIMLRPIWYYGSEELALKGLCSTIVAFGNPLVWWLGSASMIYLLVKPKKKKHEWFILIGFLSQYLPWIFISRSTFIYHFFASVPFIIISLTSVLKDISDRFKKGWFAAVVLLAVSAVLFIMFYPVISGFTVDRAYVVNILKWFESWILCF